MRDRPTPLYLTGWCTTTQTYFSPPSTSTTLQEFPAHMGDSRRVSGYQTPNGGKKFVDPTAGEYKTGYYRNPYGVYVATSKYYGQLTSIQTREGALDGSFGTRARTYSTPAYSNSVYQDAVEKFYDGLRQSETNLAVMIGEFRETGRMLQVGKSVYQLLLQARRAKRAALMNPSKTLSQIWLSYQYGWRPCLSEIYQYTHWMYRVFNDGIPIRGRSRTLEQIADQTGSPQGTSGVSYVTGKRLTQCEVKVHVGITDSVQYNASRITSMNPLSIAWELVPLSFVVDWLYDIGGYLQMMEASMGSGVSFKRGYITELYHHNLQEQFYKDYAWGNPLIGSSGTEYRASKGLDVQTWKRRTVLTAFPKPRAPTLRVKTSWQRIASAAALVRVILLGKVSGKRF